MGNRAKARREMSRDAIREQHAREKCNIEGVRRFFTNIALKHPDRSKLIFICIGSDRSTGVFLRSLDRVASEGAGMAERNWHAANTL